MALRAKFYKDKEKLRITRNAQRKRYYHKTINAKNNRKRWEKQDIELVLTSDLTDMKLSELLQRSVSAIQGIRHIHKRERGN